MNTQEGIVQSIQIRRWPTERPLFILVLMSAIAAWLLLAVSILGIVYAAMLGLFFFISHVAFIAHIRGSAVRLGPEQMPDLYNRVRELSQRIGLRTPPAVYVMQAGGTLNALATKFFSTNFIVLYSDLLEACGENTEARDMIVAHELGHLKAGHLRGLWFLLPGLFVPFLGSAYSQAREYTADRYGFALCEDRKSALIGMGILAAGGHLGPNVNLRALAQQRTDLNTTWMTLGRWLASHPPLADRIVAVESSLIANPETRRRGALGAFALILCIFVAPSIAAVSLLPKIMVAIKQAHEAKTVSEASIQTEEAEQPQLAPEEIAAATQQAWGDMEALSSAIEEYRVKTGELPQDSGAAYAAWKLLNPDLQPLVDPFDGYNYGYAPYEDSYIIWSEGPSPATQDDDLVFTPGTGAQ